MKDLKRTMKTALPAMLVALTAFSPALFGQAAPTAESLRQEINEMKRAYEARIASLEQKLAAMEATSQAASAKADEALTLAKDNAEGLDEVFAPEFLTEGLPKSITRNFSTKGYLRAGFIVNDRGSSVLNAGEEFVHPDGLFETGWRLGNEADTYAEFTSIYTFPIENGPEMQLVGTFAAKYQGDKSNYVGDDSSGTDILFRELYIRTDKVLEGNPDVAFWAGQRFYDRHDIHINDLFYLDMSGYGGGVENIDVGPGKLAVAYIGGSQDDNIVQQRGPLTEQHIDTRLSDIDMLGGKGMLWLDLAYLSGDGTDNTSESQYGAAFGFIHFKPLSGSNILGGFNKFSVMYGFGPASDFNAYVLNWRNADQIEDSETLMFTNQTMVQFNEKTSMMVAGVVQYSDLGFTSSGDRTLVSLGVRPVHMFTEHLGIQFEAGVDWVDDIRWTGDVTDEGTLYKLTIAPTIRAGGGFFARPELRLFATYAFWDDMPVWFTPAGQDYPSPREHAWMFGIQAETWW